MATVVSFYEDAPSAGPDGKPPVHLEQFHVTRANEFELGYPETGVAYVRHPVRPSRLLPLADYHPQIMQEKVNEAISMVTALGASAIEFGVHQQQLQRGSG